MTGLQYSTKIFSVIDSLKALIVALAPASQINTRYISSDGRNDEQWISYLRDESGVVDRWMITITGINGLDENTLDEAGAAVGTFTKDLMVVVDYYADYRQGLDVIGAVGSETVTNTEREFLKKIIAFDFQLEKNRRCLQTSLEILSWSLGIKLRRFDTATVHWMSGLLTIRLSDLFLTE